jgi:hypothetical protein
VVEEEGGALTNMTVLTWQIGLGETLCYRLVNMVMRMVIMM